MIIQHNIMSLNAHRQLGGNTNLVSKNLEKLSSGYKINRAGDDAAGLAISEKMRAQITGLTRAQSNAQDGISLVQTAEGALTEVHSMLNRMVDLSTQSANGTLKTDDRQKIQDEMNALSSEIDRISKSTNFNGINLLDGTLGGIQAVSTPGAVTAGTKATTTYDFAAAIAAAAPGIAIGDANQFTANSTIAFAGVAGYTYTVGGVATNATNLDEMNAMAADFNAKVTTHTMTMGADGKAVITAVGVGAGATAGLVTSADLTTNVPAPAFIPGTPAGASAGKTELTFKEQPKSGSTIEIGGKVFEFLKTGETVSDAVNVGVTLGANTEATIDALIAAAAGGDAPTDVTLAKKGTDGITLTNTNAADSSASPIVLQNGNGLSLQIGDTADKFNKVTVSVADMSAKGLGLKGIQVTAEGVSSNAIATIKAAINTVSTNRSAMGALQNRLEHTINNLGVTTENMTAAESRVRDVDMAKEMMTFTKNNVLTQAAQAMLAQANQQPQQVLQLLR